MVRRESAKLVYAGPIPAQASKVFMTSKQILEKYIKFYTDRGHKQVPNVSLVPENDPTLLFVNSGMFPLVPYLSGQSHPLGKRLVNVQRAGRFQEDLAEVGDNRHTTAFHMIGNWSLGDYFKKEQLPWVYEFFVEVLGLDINKMYATVFAGDENAPKDAESIDLITKIFAKHGVTAKEGERIFPCGKEDNWWKRGDAPGELGGPDSETFYYIGKTGNGLGLDPAKHQDEFIEIGNSVFMQYYKTDVGGWAELPQKNVDFGGGLERIALAVQQKQDIFETDNFWPIVQKIQELSGKNYLQDAQTTKAMRILADHIRACTFLAMDGVTPSNKDQGYILRRLLRRMVRAGRLLGVAKDISVNLVGTVVESFSWLYPDLVAKQKTIEDIFADEESKFAKTLAKGSVEVDKVLMEYGNVGEKKKLLIPNDAAKIAFDLYQSIGYPAEIFLEDVKDRNIEIDTGEFNEGFEDIFQEHQAGSRKGAEQKFKGGLADQNEQTIKYHTATHLLHHALRKVLGEHVIQKGSNITGERLRFDFPHAQKLTDAELKAVEAEVNSNIKKSLPVNFVTLPKAEAEKTKALHAFNEKYGDTVNVYYIGDSLESALSKEFCGGPHVKNTSELGQLEIYKQESIGKGVQRIYAKFKV